MMFMRAEMARLFAERDHAGSFLSTPIFMGRIAETVSVWQTNREC